MIRTARFLSWLFNPIVIAVFVPFLVVYKITASFLVSFRWELYSCFYLVLVVLFVLFGIKKGFFSDFDVSKRRQRPVLYFYVGSLSVLYLVSLLYLHAPLGLIVVALVLIISIVVMDFVNRFIKASGHVAIISAFILSLGIWYSRWFFVGIFVIPIVAWARIEARRHTLAEAIAGCIVGTVLTLVLSAVVQYIFLG